MDDRRELDDAVLEMLGVESAAQRQELIDELYDYLREFFELTRQKEEKAIINKNKARRRGQASPTEIAAQILAEIQENHPDLLRRYDPDFLDLTKPFDTFDLPAEGDSPGPERYESPSIRPGRGLPERQEAPRQHQYQNAGARPPYHPPGHLRHPRPGAGPPRQDECQRVLQEYADFLRRREEAIRELIANRTLDEDMQEKIYAALMPQLLYTK